MKEHFVCTNQRFVVPFLIPLFCAVCFSQSDKTSIKEDNLYSTALFASIVKMDKSWGNIDDSFGGKIRTNYHQMIVEDDPEITGGLPSQVGDYRVEYLDTQALIRRYKKLGKSFSILTLHAIRNEGSLLRITVSVYDFSYEKKKLIFAISDWSDVEFRYDCEKQSYIISDVKLGGI
jgi:hypothetical protein